MAGSPASEVSEHQSRKRRGSHITPDKAKKSTSSQSSSRIDQSTVKPASMTPAVVDATTSNILSPGKGPSAVKDKSKGPVSKGSTKPKVTKPDLMGEASKAKSGKLPVKEQEFDGNDQTAVKMDDTKANKKPAAQDKKPDTKENTVENKSDPKKLNSRDKKEKKDDGREKSTKNPETPKANQGVTLPGLVKLVSSDSESSSDDDSEDYENSDDSDSMENSDDSCGSDDSSETSEPENDSIMDFFNEYLYNDFEMEYQDLEDMDPELLAMEKAKTLRNVKAFIDGTKDKHYHHFKLDTLTGPANYISWVVGLEVLLRMHQVWPVVGELHVPLDSDHEMYLWYEHMVNAAVSLIYAHVSQKIRSHRCFMSGVLRRNPGAMMQHTWAHFGRPNADQYER